jgi:hypothetical protein
LDSILSDKFELDKLKQLFCVRDAFEHRTKVDQGSIVVDASKSGETISSANPIALSFKECRNKF